MSFEDFADVIGIISSIIFFLINFPQIFLNYRRKSTEGFSWIAILLRNLGTSFHVMIGIVTKIPFPLFLSGILNLVQIYILILQFIKYRNDIKYALGYLLTIPAIILTLSYPKSVNITQWIIPFGQIICYIPIVLECIKVGSTRGVSLLSMHLNFIGGQFGVFMCSVNGECSTIGWLYYIISVLQYIAVYLIAFGYSEYRILDNQSKTVIRKNDAIKMEKIDKQ